MTRTQGKLHATDHVRRYLSAGQTCGVFWLVLLLLLPCGCRKTEDEPEAKEGPREEASSIEAEPAFPPLPADSPLAYAPEDAILVLTLRPGQLLQSPLLADAIQEGVFNQMEQFSGLDPKTLESLVVAIVPPPESAPIKTPSLVAIAQHAEPISQEALLASFAQHLAPDSDTPPERLEYQGKTYYRLSRELAMVGYFPSPRIVVGGMEPAVKAIMAARPSSSLLTHRLTTQAAEQDLAVAVAIQPLVRLVTSMQGQPTGDAANSQLEAFQAAAEAMKMALLSVRLDDPVPLKLALEANDPSSIPQIEAFAQQMLAMAQMLVTTRKQSLSEEQAEQLGPGLDLVGQLLAGATIAKGSDGVLVQLPRPESFDAVFSEATRGALRAARQSAGHQERILHLKQLALALWNYQTANQAFPASAICDDAGKPLLSWRVAILPFLGEQELYDEFHRNEPWDSPHNQALIARMPDVYLAPGQDESTKTPYAVFVGSGTPMSPTRGPTMAEVAGEISKTILVVEAAREKAVVWTQPVDLPVVPSDPASALGDLPDGTFLAAFYDANVREVSTAMDPLTLYDWITTARPAPE